MVFGPLRQFAALGICALLSAPVSADVPAFKQAVAETAFGREMIATFYRERGYAPVFTGSNDFDRRSALLTALSQAPLHGLPASRYSVTELRRAFAQADNDRARGQAEVMAMAMFLDYARDVQSGVLTPKSIDHEIVRELPRRDPNVVLAEFLADDPLHFVKSLPPKSPEYARLMAEKLRLEHVIAHGGWGPKVRAEALEPGQSSNAVVALRNRLVDMEYLRRTTTRTYDRAMQAAVTQFQLDHGLEADGVAGATTIAAVNVEPQARIGQVIVAMERERWMNVPEGRGKRHVLVNLTDFTANIIDDGKVTFSTRSVIGATTDGRVTPEFSDTMEYMEVNPTWTVPRSIISREYLPKLRANRNAVGHLQVIDRRGRVVPRSKVNFAAYSGRNFPYSLRQPPGSRNALGTVKFMFPNPHAIYLHDTPAKHLFAREKRAYSHGCIRLNDPHDFAYALLAVQNEDPEGTFQKVLKSGRQTRISLDQPVPVHLIYRTAFTKAKGKVNYRGDIYGRDAKMWSALQRLGVEATQPVVTLAGG